MRNLTLKDRLQHYGGGQEIIQGLARHALIPDDRFGESENDVQPSIGGVASANIQRFSFVKPFGCSENGVGDKKKRASL